MNSQEILSRAVCHGNPQAVAALLERAATRLSTPGTWTQHASARSGNDAPRDPLAPDAVSWCVLGALAAEPEGRLIFAWDAVACLNLACGVETAGLLHPAAVWNNQAGRTQAEVVALLRQVAAVVRDREPAAFATGPGIGIGRRWTHRRSWRRR